METERNPRDEDAGAHGETALPFGLISLEEAAQRLHVSRQGIVSLLEQSGIPIRRVPYESHTVSAVDALELERLRPPQGETPVPASVQSLLERLQRSREPQDRELEQSRQRTRCAQAELAEARDDLRLAERASEQLDRVSQEAGQAQRRIVELTHTLGGLEAELQTAHAELARRDQQLDRQDQRIREERDRLRAEIEGERRRWATIRTDLEGTRTVRDALARQLKLARQVEAANHLYLDRIEEKLTAAHYAAEFRRRKGA